jgi:protein-S-isoprenylcysteine O-methyltransferase Ste14
MAVDEMFWRRTVVCAGALIYWGGVHIQGRRIRRRIGRSPNLKPRNARERMLWAGWLLVVLMWIGQPFVAGRFDWPAFRIHPACLHPAGLFGGALLTLAGYAATIWCYVTMGSAWRIGINLKEKNRLVTEGPFRFIRHPIYAFQALMLLGAALLLPTICSAAVVLVHLLCVAVKARDEEAYLLTVHGGKYREYMGRTGRLLPRIR